VIFAAAAAFGIGTAVLSAQKKSALSDLDALEAEYSKLAADEHADAQKKSEIAAQAKALAEKSGGVARTRAAMFAADIAFADKNWEESRTYWLMAAKAQSKAYTAPICFYNAAVCSEEAGDLDAAVSYFNTAAENKDFPLVPHALFNAGRIEESRGNYAQAAALYEKLNASHSGTDWANLGKSRIIALRASGKIQ
jgi:TPR repeat-containing protein TP_0282